MPQTTTTELMGVKVVDFHGDKIGTIKRLLHHGEAQEPTWALVAIGPLGLSGAVIPLCDAIEEGGDLALLYEREHVRSAPSVALGGERISDADADALHRHYGLDRVTGMTAPGERDAVEELSRKPREATIPAEESSGGKLAERRRRRAREFGVPQRRLRG